MTWRRLVLSGVGVWMALALALDHYGAHARPPDTADLIVVAGCRVLPNGQASPCLALRVARAVQLWEAGVARTVLMTGGVGEHPPSEAAVARDLAVALGMPSQAVLTEDRSTSTFENALFASGVVEAERVVVVTDSFHVFRAVRVFGYRYPNVTGIGVQGRVLRRVQGACREVFAVAWYVATGRM